MSVACLALCLALILGAGAVPAQCAEIGREQAFAIALKNAGVPERDAYNVEIKSDRENGIAIFKVEFETRYGDYEFEVARESGRIIGADYEVDDDWLRTLGGSPVSLDEAKRVVQKKVPGSHRALRGRALPRRHKVRIRDRPEDGPHSRLERGPAWVTGNINRVSLTVEARRCYNLHRL